MKRKFETPPQPIGAARICKAVLALIGITMAVGLLVGCSGPSKARYAELLHECRDHNREHLRMLKEYEKMECKAHPEQAYGSVEMGLGGL